MRLGVGAPDLGCCILVMRYGSEMGAVLRFRRFLVCLALLVSEPVAAQFYCPDDPTYNRPSDYSGLRMQDFFFRSENGTTLHGWLILARSLVPLERWCIFMGMPGI